MMQNGREYQVDAQQGFRMPPNITEAASNPRKPCPYYHIKSN